MCCQLGVVTFLFFPSKSAREQPLEHISSCPYLAAVVGIGKRKRVSQFYDDLQIASAYSDVLSVYLC